jgi:hypothetical protein
MFYYALGIALLVAGLGWIVHDSNQENIEAARQQRVTAIAADMTVYNSRVVDYAIANPAATGPIPNASLSLPTWYAGPAFSNNILADGTVRVWIAPGATAGPEQNQILAVLNEDMRGYEDLGYVNATGFTHPIVGPKTNATYVAGIPAGSIAIFTKVR